MACLLAILLRAWRQLQLQVKLGSRSGRTRYQLAGAAHASAAQGVGADPSLVEDLATVARPWAALLGSFFWGTASS